ncbi:DUF6799 domain-containing protein [Hymenobacter psychrophilus]|uniref:DUF6799 domain-containing protein n=1 Tax=Hymenobacter psychrophilus TaxID=651662 RepID=A0A1H3I2L1_9BACT|nr:DUF6799 domain-containing protein [Hymenobacter psychrophilus]SDY21926.1 hypothetical protein SAMN04488069_106260 [Hymenobacter psychrophilus]
MKFFVSLAAALLLGGAVAAQAQTKAATPPARRGVQPKPRMVSNGATMKDGFLMKDGKVLETRDAHTGAISTESALVNGTKVQPDGTIMMADGTTVRLQEGDYMSLTGRLTTRAMKAEQDSLRQVQIMKAKGKKKR